MPRSKSVKSIKPTGVPQDIGLIITSIFVAYMLVKTGTLIGILTTISPFGIIAGLIGGALFTSAFSTAIAIVMLGELSLIHPLPVIAFFGACGAMLGDLIMFHFVKKHILEHIQPKVCTIRSRNWWCKLVALLKIRSFRWLSLIVAGLVIASPLPDEIGISIFSFAKIKRSWLIGISFIFNFVGIWIVGVAARAIAGM